MKIIIMVLILLFINISVFAKDTRKTTSSTTQINDISWNEVTRVEKVKKIIARITILRILGVVPASFWNEFGLDLDKDTIDWEKIDGIDIDMVLSAHEAMTQEIEAKLNENGSTLGGEEFLRTIIISSSLKILGYHIKNGKLVDEEFEPILSKNLQKKIKDRITEIIKNRINPEDGINGEGLPSNSDSTSQFTNGYKNRISDLFSGFDSDDPMGSLADQLSGLGKGTNWSDVAGIGNDMNGEFINWAKNVLIGIESTGEGVLATGGMIAFLFTDVVFTTTANTIFKGEFSAEGSWSYNLGFAFAGLTNNVNMALERNSKELEIDELSRSISYEEDKLAKLKNDPSSNPNDISSLETKIESDKQKLRNKKRLYNMQYGYTYDTNNGEKCEDTTSEDTTSEDTTSEDTTSEEATSEDTNDEDTNDEDKNQTDNCDEGTSCDNSTTDDDDSTTSDDKNSKDKMGENDPDAPWNENNTSTGSGIPTSKDIDNINDNSNNHGGTTYVENSTRITATELETAMKRIEVIKNQYGVNCNEVTGEDCMNAGNDFKNDPLINGDAVTNPGLLEK